MKQSKKYFKNWVFWSCFFYKFIIFLKTELNKVSAKSLAIYQKTVAEAWRCFDEKTTEKLVPINSGKIYSEYAFERQLSTK